MEHQTKLQEHAAYKNQIQSKIRQLQLKAFKSNYKNLDLDQENQEIQFISLPIYYLSLPYCHSVCSHHHNIQPINLNPNSNKIQQKHSQDPNNINILLKKINKLYQPNSQKTKILIKKQNKNKHRMSRMATRPSSCNNHNNRQIKTSEGNTTSQNEYFQDECLVKKKKKKHKVNEIKRFRSCSNLQNYKSKGKRLQKRDLCFNKQPSQKIMNMQQQQKQRFLNNLLKFNNYYNKSIFQNDCSRKCRKRFTETSQLQQKKNNQERRLQTKRKKLTQQQNIYQLRQNKSRNKIKKQDYRKSQQ